ncbi:hypothetical protein TW95_gp1336 [Pandoravirus inopinatum]|uniref:Uncharacterized protein n=1 Tax=Pandoravirus inopinatum TaxID=1605721 RepID=A0A0B5J822_9VIRU|nr:hypothetical protein TW95_gp1336 [Pandoravirus inopinatum]AJF98070.1 hypothetical protein [Pandoravirus inopinatum]
MPRIVGRQVGVPQARRRHACTKIDVAKETRDPVDDLGWQVIELVRHACGHPIFVFFSIVLVLLFFQTHPLKLFCVPLFCCDGPCARSSNSNKKWQSKPLTTRQTPTRTALVFFKNIFVSVMDRPIRKERLSMRPKFVVAPRPLCRPGETDTRVHDRHKVFFCGGFGKFPWWLPCHGSLFMRQ